MSSTGCPLLGLPLLPFNQIMDVLVDTLGLRKALPLRQVCSRFDFDIIEVIYHRRFNNNPQNRYRHPGPTLSMPIIARLLLRRLEKDSTSDNRLVSVIRGMIPLEVAQYDQDFDLPRSSIPLTIFLAAADCLGSSRIEELMRAEKHQAVRVPNSRRAKEMENAILTVVPQTNALVMPVPKNEDLLAVAAFCGNTKTIERLILAGTNVNCCSDFFGMPLRAAAIQGHNETVECLLERGADVNAVDESTSSDEYTALKAAVQRNRKSVVSLLFEPRYQLKPSGRHYQAAITTAALAGHKEMINFLIKHGNYKHASFQQFKVLWLASGKGHIDVVDMLLDRHLNLKKSPTYTMRALEAAAANGHHNIILLLLAKGAYVERTANANAHHGFDMAFQSACQNGHKKVVKLLYGASARVKVIGPNGKTPLCKAAEAGSIEIMNFLLKRGGKFGTGKGGIQALDHGVHYGVQDVVRFLVAKGIDPNGEKGCQIPPVLRALQRGDKATAELLVKLGAKNINPLESVLKEDFLSGRLPKGRNVPPMLKN